MGVAVGFIKEACVQNIVVVEMHMDEVHAAIQREPALWSQFVKDEEYSSERYDRHTRFLYSSSRFRSPEDPAVSRYLMDQGFVAEYPDDAPFAVVLSHDVDDMFVAPRQIAFAVRNSFRHRSVKPAVQLVNGFFHPKKSPYRTIQKILEVECRYDAHSSFYFLASPEDVFGRKYTLQDVEGDMKDVLDAGSEIGFHTQFSSFDNFEEIQRQKKALEAVLGAPVIGARNHVMRFQTPQTWWVLREAGFQYDSTYGYPDVVGFRNGMAHPFVPFDQTSHHSIPILEVPVMVQDWTMLWWMRLSPQESFQKVSALMDAVERCHGILTILWHSWTYSYPVSFGGFFTPEWTMLYEKILQLARRRKAWVTDTRALHDHIASGHGRLHHR